MNLDQLNDQILLFIIYDEYITNEWFIKLEYLHIAVMIYNDA